MRCFYHTSFSACFRKGYTSAKEKSCHFVLFFVGIFGEFLLTVCLRVVHSGVKKFLFDDLLKSKKNGLRENCESRFNEIQVSNSRINFNANLKQNYLTDSYSL